MKNGQVVISCACPSSKQGGAHQTSAPPLLHNRYDIGVFTNCKADMNTYCKDARTQFRGNATVLKCLTDNFPNLADSCQVGGRHGLQLCAALCAQAHCAYKNSQLATFVSTGVAVQCGRKPQKQEQGSPEEMVILPGLQLCDLTHGSFLVNL